jgi:hypothetical protein
MSVHDYLLDHDGFDWAGLLSGWSWLLPPEFTVWLVNRFGDLFLAPPDGTVHMLDVGAGTLTKLAQSRDDFLRKIDEGDDGDDWLMIPLVDRLTAAGIVTGCGECYSYRIPPVMGGGYTVENTAVLKIAEHYGAYGSIHGQLRDVPDGAKVVLKVRE